MKSIILTSFLILFSYSNLICQKISYSKLDSQSENLPNSKSKVYLPLSLLRDTTKYIYTDEEGERWELIYKGEASQDLIKKYPNGKLLVQADTNLARQVSNVLLKADQEILFNQFLGREIFRLTWLRSHDAPVVITIEEGHMQGKFHITTKIVGGDKLIADKLSLSTETWKKVIGIFKRENFWNLPSYQNNQLITGGDILVLETHQEDGYYLVARKEPDNIGFKMILDQLIELSTVSDSVP